MSQATESAAPVPARNDEAEEAVLGELMLAYSWGTERGAAVLRDVQATGLERRTFYLANRNGLIFDAILAVAARGEPADSVTVGAELARQGQLEDVGGKVRVNELASRAKAVANAAHHAELILACHRTRALVDALKPVMASAQDGGVIAGEALEALAEARAALEAGRATATRSRLTPAGAFIFEAAERIPAVWGRGGAVLWAEGESLMVVGPEGVSKSTLAQRLTLARVGIGSSTVLGFPVAPTAGRVLYLALDRPKQIARSFRRMVTDSDRAALDERVTVHGGALVLDVLTKPLALAELAQAEGATTLVLDSLKDLAAGLADDKIGAAVNIARQHVLTAGIDLLEIHHQRKPQAENKKPNKLGDVYGSRWLTAGAGSVVLLWGEAGDVLLELSHLKQPGEEVGPWTLTVDHATGAVAVHEAPEVAALLTLYPVGVTAKDAAANLTGKPEPSRSDVEKARRKLEKLIGEGVARRIEPHPPEYPETRYVERIERGAK